MFNKAGTNPSLKKWLQVSIFNLLLVAFAGVILRYKIAFSLPIVNQKFLLQAHSHFAFAGWITQALMTLMVGYLCETGDPTAFQRFRKVLYANLVTAYGMLLTFPFIGYAFLSIVFSTASIFASWWFGVIYWRALARSGQKNVTHYWFKAAIIFSVISAFGAFSLAFMLATRHVHPNTYLASVYFFLHFQYNGWFFFACMGLLAKQLLDSGIENKKLMRSFVYFVVACPPAYFLSALWLKIPLAIYVLVVIAVFFQLAGWVMTVRSVAKVLPLIKLHLAALPRAIFLLSGMALSIKFCLQAGSVIPSLSDLAFGFRPIVIGYLHLALLGVITLFLLAYSLTGDRINFNWSTTTGMIIFAAAVVLNEILLMTQGVADLYYEAIPYINHSLLFAALCLFAGLCMINYGQWIAPKEHY